MLIKTKYVCDKKCYVKSCVNLRSLFGQTEPYDGIETEPLAAKTSKSPELLLLICLERGRGRCESFSVKDSIDSTEISPLNKTN